MSRFLLLIKHWTPEIILCLSVLTGIPQSTMHLPLLSAGFSLEGACPKRRGGPSVLGSHPGVCTDNSTEPFRVTRCAQAVLYGVRRTNSYYGIKAFLKVSRGLN